MTDNASSWSPTLTLKPAAERAPITPRDHQVASWDRLTKHYLDEKKRAGLVVVPTGGGKTILAAHWLLEHHISKGGRVLWLAHRRSLIRQAFESFRFLGNVAYPKQKLNMIAISSIDASWSNVDPSDDVVFASMQTAVLEGNLGFVEKLIDESRKGFFVVVDEAHHAAAPGYLRLLKMLKGKDACLLGLTATPVRMDDDDQARLNALFDGQIVYQVTRRYLTEQGILAAPAFETVKTEVNLEKDFTPEDIRYLERFGEIGPAVLKRLSKHAGRNQLIVEHYLEKKELYGPTIVFAADTLHASTLASEFQKRGVDADYVDYSRGDSQKVIQRYRLEKKPDVLVNVEMLTEGFDAPHTRTVFIARPTRSPALLTQMVGRALRGRKSNGNDIAYLVTFLDTWEQFNVLDAEYVIGEPPEPPPPPTGRPQSPPLFIIPPELVREAYSMLKSNIKGTKTGVFQCLPQGWYAWEEVFEDDEQRRTVMFFDNQAEPFERLLAAYPTPESVPASVDEDVARALIRQYFVDVVDPLPRWADVKALLDARRKGCEILRYTFEDKARFDPTAVADHILKNDLTVLQRSAYLQEIWNSSAACRHVYRDDFSAFNEDVDNAQRDRTPGNKTPIPVQVVNIVPTNAPRAWGEGEQGYSLVKLRDAVLSVKKHFPNGPPTIGGLLWTTQAHSSYWGFYRYSDKTISINCILNSPDIPLFVAEYLMYHEMLHADMPSAGHNRDFRQKEWAFQPSADAIMEAEKRGIAQGTTRNYWYVRAAGFLDTFDRYYAHKKPGTSMDL